MERSIEQLLSENKNLTGDVAKRVTHDECHDITGRIGGKISEFDKRVSAHGERIARQEVLSRRG